MRGWRDIACVRLKFLAFLSLPFCYCKKQIDVSFSCVCPVIVLLLSCGSTRLSPRGSTATLTMLRRNSWSNNRTDAWKTDINLLNTFLSFFFFFFFGGGGGAVFALKQWISNSLKHETVPRSTVNNLYCFLVKNLPKRIALWDIVLNPELSIFVIWPWPSLHIVNRRNGYQTLNFQTRDQCCRNRCWIDRDPAESVVFASHGFAN